MFPLQAQKHKRQKHKRALDPYFKYRLHKSYQGLSILSIPYSLGFYRWQDFIAVKQKSIT